MYVPIPLIQGVLTVDPTDNDYEADAGTRVWITSAFLHNPTAGNVIVTGRLTPDGGAATQTMKDTIMAGEKISIHELEGQILNAGDLIDFVGVGVNCFVSGVIIPTS